MLHIRLERHLSTRPISYRMLRRPARAQTVSSALHTSILATRTYFSAAGILDAEPQGTEHSSKRLMLTKLRERQNQRAPELASHRGLQGDLVLTNPGNCRYQTRSRPYHQFSISSVHLAELLIITV